jgi:hypothetical protein
MMGGIFHQQPAILEGYHAAKSGHKWLGIFQPEIGGLFSIDWDGKFSLVLDLPRTARTARVITFLGVLWTFTIHAISEDCIS